MPMDEAVKKAVSADDRERELLEQLRNAAESAGYHINPDDEFVMMLMEGLVANMDRYGYAACPCRLADGDPVSDLDIVCPCDYRDPDLDEHEACYCALYVSDSIFRGEKQARPIPERRPPREERAADAAIKKGTGGDDRPAGPPTWPGLAFPVWRCRVCGYLCARNDPPETCPICKVKKDRFERFL